MSALSVSGQTSRPVHIALHIINEGQCSYSNHDSQSSGQSFRGSSTIYSIHGGYFG